LLMLTALPTWALDARLSKGEVLVETLTSSINKHQQGVQVKMLINRPLAQVYATIRNTEASLANDTAFKKVKVIKRIGSHQEQVAYHMRNLPFSYVNLVTFYPNKGTSFSRISGSFKSIEGGSQLQAIDEQRTLLTYQLRVVPDVPIPQWMTNTILKIDLPRSLRTMRQAVYDAYPSS
ncbi:MAG: hypothetical protein ACKO34_08060, partial [Vampirovibrionales bacterium]